jgi:GGDEF domain-containing protein
VLIPVGGEEEARRIAERLRSIVERSPYRDGTVTIALTVSVGLAMHRAGYALSDALSAADRRLYQASRGGDNRVIADEELFGSAVV